MPSGSHAKGGVLNSTPAPHGPASRSQTATTANANAKRSIQQRHLTLLVAALTLLGLGLRLHQLTLAPLPTDNADEINWGFVGISLIAHHVPYGWSYLAAYPTRQWVKLHGSIYPMVHPWLDQPPAFALLVGWVAWLGGARNMAGISFSLIRMVPVLLSTASVPLIFFLGTRTRGRGAAIIGAALYASAPGAVLLGREVESEALLAPMLIVSLLSVEAIIRDRASGTKVGLLLALCLLGPLVKLPGLAIAAISVVLLIAGGHKWLALSAFLAGVAGIGIYALYGWAIDWHTFTAVIHSQMARRQGLMGGYQTLIAQAGINRGLSDWWWLLGLLAIGALAFGNGEDAGKAFVAWPVAAYAATLLLMADPRVIPVYGWYRITIYPLVYLAAGHACAKTVSRPTASRLILLMATGGAATLNFLFGTPGQGWTPPALAVGIVLAAVGLLGAVMVASRGAGRLGSSGRFAVAVAICLMVAGGTVQSYFLAHLYSRL